MNSLQDLVESIRGTLLDRLGRVVAHSPERMSIPVDLLESDEAFLAVFDAPGTTSSDVQVQLSGRTIEVRIDRFRQPADEFELAVSGRSMALDGEVDLPKDVTLAGGDGKSILRENGTLEVRIPKRDNSKPASVKDVVDKEFSAGYEDESTPQGDSSTDETQQEAENGDFEEFETKTPDEQEAPTPDSEQQESKDPEEIEVSEPEDGTENTDEGAETGFEEFERPAVSDDDDATESGPQGEN